MSDEVRSSSRSTPPEPEASPTDPVGGPTSLEIDIPTPDLELGDADSDERPTAPGPIVVIPALDAARDVAAPWDAATPWPPPALEVAPPRSERPPPPPSQRPPHLRPEARPDAPPLLAPTIPTLPAPAPVLNATPLAVPPAAPVPAIDLLEAEPPPAPREAVTVPVPAATTAEPVRQISAVTEPAPPPRMQSEPVPLVIKAGSAPPRPSMRPGLVEPKRIIEVLGSNVPVLDTALEEEGIEDLDESEARELTETPVPDSPEAEAGSDTDLDLPVVIEDDFASAPADADPARATTGTTAASNVHELVPLSVPADPLDPLDEPELPAGPRAKAPPNKRKRPPPPSSRHHEKPKPLESPGPRKWWEEMFSEEFLRAIPILSSKQLEREVNFIDDALSVERGGRILDLACGAGQHAVELAARGYDVVGFDLSQSQLDWAGGLAQERGQRLQFTYGDMRDLVYSEAFDAIYSWNTSFGFFEEDKNVEVAQRIFRALRPGGRFLLDVINRDFVVAQQPGQTWFEGDGCVCIDDVSIDFITSRMKVKRTMMLTNGKNRECNYSVRIYGLHELGKILHDVGFKVLNVSGRPEMPGVFFGSTSPRIIILAVKP
jgi:SAM-dependent methyltransferase